MKGVSSKELKHMMSKLYSRGEYLVNVLFLR